MAFFGGGSPVGPRPGQGPSFFSMPGSAKGIMSQGLVLNVMRSLQFSYMVMKGLKLTSRALRDMDVFQDEGTSPNAGKLRWRMGPGGSTGGQGGRGGGGGHGTGIKTGIRGGSMGIGTRMCSTGRSSSSSKVGFRIIRGRGRSGRQVRCPGTGESVGTRARGEGNVQGKGKAPGGNGASASADRGQTNGSKGSSSRGKSGGGTGCDPKMTSAADSSAEPTLSPGAHGAVPEGLIERGMAVGAFKGSSESGLVRKIYGEISVFRVWVVDGISDRLTAMKGVLKSVKVATGVVSGAKTASGVFQKVKEPVGGVLLGFGAGNGVVLGFEMARMLVKGVKITKDFAGVWRCSRTWLGINRATGTRAFGAVIVRERFVKGLKISDGALTLVNLTKDFGGYVGGTLHEGISSWDLMSKGYDASNGLVKVLEACIGVKGGGVIGLVGKGFTAIKGAIGTLGISAKVVKVVFVSQKATVALFQGFGLSKTMMDAFKAIQEGNRMLGLQQKSSGSLEVENVDDPLHLGESLALPKRWPGKRTHELLVTQFSLSSTSGLDFPPPMMISLASLLAARGGASNLGHSSKGDMSSWSSTENSVFWLSLPS